MMSQFVRGSLCAALLACCPWGMAADDTVRLLTGNHEAAQARIDLIQQAQHEIVLAYYQINDDPLALLHLSLLADAARRGVTVRLLVDGLRNRMSPEVQAQLIRAGVELKEYHPATVSKPGWFNRRLHDKLLVVDQREMVIGSRNLEEEHFGLERPCFLDRDAYVRGDTARRAHHYFTCLWNSDQVDDAEPSNDLLESLVRRQAARSGGLRPPEEYHITIDCQPLCLANACDWSAGGHEAQCVCFLYDPCGRKGHPRGISRRIDSLIDQAQASVVLEAPYFVMSNSMQQSLVNARARGVQVILLTNSLATNKMLVYAAYSNQKRFLLGIGVELWEFAGPRPLHAKSAVIDGYLSIIGSYNFDPRSEHLNTEVAIVVNDAPFAQELGDSIGERLSNSYRVGPDGRMLGATKRHPAAARTKILAIQPMRIFVPAIRRSL